MVPGGEGEALGGGEEAGFAAEVQDFAVGAEEGGDDVGVAGDFAEGGGGDGSGEDEVPAPVRVPVPVSDPVSLSASGPVRAWVRWARRSW